LVRRDSISNGGGQRSVSGKTQTGVQLWRTWLISWPSAGVGKERKYKSLNHREYGLLWDEAAYTVVWRRVLKVNRWKEAG
jgi:hypothetical protein